MTQATRWPLVPSGALCLGTLREHGQLRRQKGIAQEDDRREKQHQMRLPRERRKVKEGVEIPLVPRNTLGKKVFSPEKTLSL